LHNYSYFIIETGIRICREVREHDEETSIRINAEMYLGNKKSIRYYFCNRQVLNCK